ncbi:MULTISPECIES: hypothetical protein [unclassified Helicobacter]|uniref:hypothetical protein n=1 Tax=unclassified Helicobacter TaxID=2593540 RepID=UPI000CF1C2DE|nr:MULTISPECIES: hypothetical protein [unclassified Helicobacter]
MCIIGGEPLLFRQIAQVVEALDARDKIKHFYIVTNGTIDFKEDLLRALGKSNKACVHISDYSKSPNLTIPLRQESIIKKLKANDIVYHLRWEKKDNAWFDPGKIYKRGRDRDGIRRNFLACKMICVSIMSNEGIRVADNTKSKCELQGKQNDSGESDKKSLVGAMFVCPIASSLSRLLGLEEFSGDYINLQNFSRQDIVDFYAKDFYKACDYCRDMWKKNKRNSNCHTDKRSAEARSLSPKGVEFVHQFRII